MAALKRTLKIVAAAFAGAGVIFVVVFAAADLGEPQNPDLADGAVLASAALGVIGLLVALQWWSRAAEQTRTPTNLQMGFIMRVAIAELGLLTGILAVFMTGTLTAAVIGLGLFLASLLLMVTGLDRIPEV